MITNASNNHVRTAMPPRSNRDWALTAFLEEWSEEQVHQRLRRRLHGKAMAKVWDFFHLFKAVYQRCCELEEEQACFARHPRPLPFQTAKAQSKKDKRAGRKRPSGRKTRVTEICTWAEQVQFLTPYGWLNASELNGFPLEIVEVESARWGCTRRRNSTDRELNIMWSNRLHAEQKSITAQYL